MNQKFLQQPITTPSNRYLAQFDEFRCFDSSKPTNCHRPFSYSSCRSSFVTVRRPWNVRAKLFESFERNYFLEKLSLVIGEVQFARVFLLEIVAVCVMVHASYQPRPTNPPWSSQTTTHLAISYTITHTRTIIHTHAHVHHTVRQTCKANCILSVYTGCVSSRDTIAKRDDSTCKNKSERKGNIFVV